MKQPIFLDTSCFIYVVEKNNEYNEKVKILFDKITVGEITAISSIITLSEVLVQPIKNNDTTLINLYIELFNQLPNFSLVSPNYGTAIQAARIRAGSNISLPDAYQLALANEHNCKSFVTNDNGLKKFKDLEVLVLNDLILN